MVQRRRYDKTCGTGVPPVSYHCCPGHDMGGSGHECARTDHDRDGLGTIDPEEVHIRHGAFLPHWSQEGAVYFVTFRLADSLPRSAVETWVAEREAIAKNAKLLNRQLTMAEQDRLRILFSERVEAYLDKGHGVCWLKEKRIARIVQSTLLHFHGQRYLLFAWCVMPNHIHVVLCPERGHDLSGILHSWKSFSAKKANKALNRTGGFWQAEYYDHIVRDEEDFDRCVEYTYYNPERAGMEGWQWRGYVDDVESGGHSMGVHGQDGRATIQGEDVVP